MAILLGHEHVRCSLSKKIAIAPALFRRRLLSLLGRSGNMNVYEIDGIYLPDKLEKIEGGGNVIHGNYREFGRLALERTIELSDILLMASCRSGYLSIAAKKILPAPGQVLVYEWNEKFREQLQGIFELNGYPAEISDIALGGDSRKYRFPKHYYYEFWQDDFADCDFYLEVQAKSLKEELDTLSCRPSYLVCFLDHVSSTIFSDDATVNQFSKILIITTPSGFSLFEVKSLLHGLISSGWCLDVWPGSVFYLFKN